MRSTYFPILRGKLGEIEAIGQLSPTARMRTRPMLDLPLPKADQNLERFLCGTLQDVVTSWGTGDTCYVDVSQYGPEVRTRNGRFAVQHVFDSARQCGLRTIPVTAPFSIRERVLISAIKEVSNRAGRGVAIRVPHEEYIVTETLNQAIDDVRVTLALEEEQIDVFLDAGPLATLPAMHGTPAGLFANWNGALTALENRNFRNVILCASSIPELTKSPVFGVAQRMPRVELIVWRELTKLSGRFLGFGDYGARYGHQLDPDGPVRVPGRVNLSTSGEYCFYRGKQEEHRDLTCRVAESTEFRSQPDCWGKEAIRACGIGHGNIGAPKDWVARDTNMMIELTVRELDSHWTLLGRALPGAASHYPWLQARLLD